MLESKKNSFSISRNRYLSIKDEKLATNFPKNTATNKKIRHSSNTHSQQIIDNNLDKLIKKEFTSLSVKELNN
jgi:pantothenate synthetase